MVVCVVMIGLPLETLRHIKTARAQPPAAHRRRHSRPHHHRSRVSQYLGVCCNYLWLNPNHLKTIPPPLLAPSLAPLRLTINPPHRLCVCVYSSATIPPSSSRPASNQQPKTNPPPRPLSPPFAPLHLLLQTQAHRRFSFLFSVTVPLSSSRPASTLKLSPGPKPACAPSTSLTTAPHHHHHPTSPPPPIRPPYSFSWVTPITSNLLNQHFLFV